MRTVTWSELDAATQEAVLTRPTHTTSATTQNIVAGILADIRDRGDAAVLDAARRLDGSTAMTVAQLRICPEERAAAAESISPVLKQAIDDAAGRIRAFHEPGGVQEYTVTTAPGVECRKTSRPIGTVGLYVPAGSAPLPSTALMLGIPAQLAGCPRVILCCPPSASGTIDPAVLYAASVSGITEILCLGGAQAIGALAYGTSLTPPVDKIFGPGNAFVTEAKRQVSSQDGGCGIDMPAGPSEVLVIADSGAHPAYVAADLLSQAEHGPDSQVLCLSDDAELLAAIAREVDTQVAVLPRADIARRALDSSQLIACSDLDTAVEISNRYAPEHLILAVRDPESLLPSITPAGSVFCGDFSPETLGDYCSGTNHVLPTAGAARFTGGVSVESFQRPMTVQIVSRAGLDAIGPCAMEIAAAEGLQAHLTAVELRLKDEERA